MSSEGKTQFLELNQWVATDPVNHEDFNADNLLIDSAVKELYSVVQDAQSTADGITATSLGRGYGTCSTAAGTTAKTCSISGFARSAGAVVGVRFTYANTASSPTLNVNSTGAAAIYDYSTGTYPASGSMVAGGTHFFMFNGTQWVLLNPAGAAKIATGSYTGTGTYGSSSPNSLTFAFAPKLLFIGGGNYANQVEPFIYGAGSFTVLTTSTSPSPYSCTVTTSGNTISWYNTASERWQLNETRTYYYVAIG